MPAALAHDDLLRRAKELDLPDQHHIDGVDEPGGGASFAVVSPRDGQVLVEVPDARSAEVDLAVAAARRAFDSGPWPRLAPADRGRILLRVAELLEEQREKLALTITLEMGKPFREAHDIELRAAINTFRWYGQLADKLTDESPHTAPDALALVTREPTGVVGAVVPWNFPLTLASWKVAPALAAGCTVVLKPSENSPLSALLLGRIATEAGLPPGVLNVVTGDGPTAGRAIGLHPDVDVLAFTGSTAVGRHFLHYAADSNLKRVWLELGGKSPNIILPDAPDLERAAATAAWGIFFNQGEMCTAPSRLLVHSSVAERVTDAIVARAGELRVGDPLDPATEMGALVREAHLERVLGHIGTGVTEGARLRAGGERTLTGTGGSYLRPTVFDRVDPGMRLAREEIFGPVLSVLTFDDLDEAVRLANATEYGLAAGLWTSDLSTAHQVSRALKAGTVWVNCYEEGDLTVPFGGMKQSGNGRDKSAHAVEKYTELKTTWIQL
ncbi:aldehyde dehydrogenase [Streptomyces europaeiscabiei]|uniref:Aldehyde dehydrogenase n=1 Tax=Streptomyces europaeiscabiei TaxID=146819 RepID=A0ABU4NKD7_9ACTN|nr:aldehyde dehydrogenase [Streptomyces europaeiscabiei]MDX2527565.1 aldehyde dehydrogenase [Streptomyces europaeiscabiei]MDX2760479.1 aldehyde dehydrogenase [Streptomyces europaeiscabiei]MDX2769011.1 aldehyde dehydrogenase [Streptomyces europaeiscabiei]MDX3545846.1 aldehyde dehydrogenase [Streptomyces europaeiscabiei]MDX3555535.1 aldehyde dehydrogenase [Streptomyces europaeiscabiei]